MSEPLNRDLPTVLSIDEVIAKDPVQAAGEVVVTTGIARGYSTSQLSDECVVYKAFLQEPDSGRLLLLTAHTTPGYSSTIEAMMRTSSEAGIPMFVRGRLNFMALSDSNETRFPYLEVEGLVLGTYAFGNSLGEKL